MRLFSDPAWDMLLELYGGSDAAEADSFAPVGTFSDALTTTLRWIVSLEAEGIVEREVNPLDRRQIFIILTIELSS